jgi:hypothetical protein
MTDAVAGGMRPSLVGAFLLCSATAVAQPGDAPPPAPTGPSGSAQPIDPYGPTSGQPIDPYADREPPNADPGPAPSQHQAPSQAPEPATTPPDAHPQPPTSEQQPTPPIDKPAPIDQPEPAPAKPALIDPATAPAACRDAASRALSADGEPEKISFAICSANAALAALQIVDAEGSVREVNDATANAFAILDDVAGGGDVRWQIIALHAEGDLLATMTRRMVDTVPPPGAGAPPSAVALHDMRVQMVQPLVRPWVERAHEAFAKVGQLAQANPQATTSKQAASAIADSRRQLTR